MKYKIERTEKKTTQQGKPFIKAVLKDEASKVVEDVLIWSDFPGFEKISPGVEAEGTVRESARGFKNLKPAHFPYPPVTNNALAKATHEAATERTSNTTSEYVQAYDRAPVRQNRSQIQEKSVGYYDRTAEIRAAQERKNQAIAYFNATNSAISLISNLKGKNASPLNRTIIKQELEYWRDWFLNQWKHYESHDFNRTSAESLSN